MPEQLILDKLDQMEKKVDKIETAVALIAVQSERLNNVTSQVHALWVKHDEVTLCLNKVKNYQSSCPRTTLKENVNMQWVVIGLLATAVTGCLLKAFGGVG